MALLDFLQLTPKTQIGAIEVMAALEEVFTDTLQTTDHPIEAGADITDHAFIRPSEVVLRCGWTNSSFTALTGAAQAIFDGGNVSAANYIDNIYSQLLALQRSRVPFDLQTSKRLYSNMLIISLRVDTDTTTGNALMLMATCKQIIIVNTQATTLPPREQQAAPQNTAETEKTGVKQTKPKTPSPGGSRPPVARPAPIQPGGGQFNGNGATGGW